MPVRLVNITNISNQVIKVLYGSTLNGNPASKLEHIDAGELSIAPGSNIDIEENRLDLGQIESFRQKRLIAYTIR